MQVNKSEFSIKSKIFLNVPVVICVIIFFYRSIWISYSPSTIASISSSYPACKKTRQQVVISKVSFALQAQN